MAWVYILKCSDGTFYTGWTVDLEKRVKAHNRAKGARYTRARTPVTLVYAMEYADRRAAMREEFRIKKLSRKEKQKLVDKDY